MAVAATRRRTSRLCAAALEGSLHLSSFSHTSARRPFTRGGARSLDAKLAEELAYACLLSAHTDAAGHFFSLELSLQPHRRVLQFLHVPSFRPLVPLSQHGALSCSRHWHSARQPCT